MGAPRTQRAANRRNIGTLDLAAMALRERQNFEPATRIAAASTALAGSTEKAQEALVHLRLIDPPAVLERKDRSRRSTPAGILLERVLFRIYARVAGSQSKGEVTNAVGETRLGYTMSPKPTICVSHVVTGHFHLGTMRCPRFRSLVPVSSSNQWFQALGG